jgi:ABC-type nitrate/sulfonate/bicarbonate transport system permease component
MRRSSRLGLSTLSIVIAIIIWAVVAALMRQPELLPGPVAVSNVFKQLLASGELVSAISQSLVRVGVGYAVGAVLGIVTGVVLGRLRIFHESFGIVFEFLKGIPPIALVPIVIIWLGIGEVSKYVVIAYIVWIVVTISTAVGAHEIPVLRLRTGAFLALGKLAVFRRIVLPSIIPYVLIGLRSGIGFAFVALVSAELIAANSGIGQIIMDARFSLQTDKMIVGLFVLGVLGATIQVAFDFLVARLPVMKRLQRERHLGGGSRSLPVREKSCAEPFAHERLGAFQFCECGCILTATRDPRSLRFTLSPGG